VANVTSVIGVRISGLARLSSGRPKAIIPPKPRAPLQRVSSAALAWRPVAVLTAAVALVLVGVPTTLQAALAPPLASVASTLNPGAGGPTNAGSQARRTTDGVNAGEVNQPRTRNPEAGRPSRIEVAPEKLTGAATDTVLRAAIAAPEEPSPTSSNAANTIAQSVAARGGRLFQQTTKDMTLWENAPNFVGSSKDAPFRTNRWGMRDKDYSLAPPPRTYRVALLGSSLTVGSGVPLEQTMETLLEDRLNREGPGAPGRRYEILNFSVGMYGIMQNAALLDQKVFAFKPNAVLVAVFSVDGRRMSTYLVKLIRARVPIPYPYVREKLRQSGVDASMKQPELLRRLAPISEDLVRWSYQHIIEVCRQRGVTVLGIVLPEPVLKAGHDIDQAARLAAAGGLPLLDLRGVYAGQSPDSLQLSRQGDLDAHWNARAHKLVSDRIYQLLRQNDARALKLGFKARTMSSTNPPMVARQQATVGAWTTIPRASLARLASQPTTPARQQLKGPWIRMTGDFLEFELRPSYTIAYPGGFPFSTNRWGMRDKEYSLVPPPRTYRIALLGSSVEMGAGVPGEQDYESVLEARLNREGPQTPRRHYEILNFSVGAYSILQNVVVAERKVLPFAPNAIMLAIHPLEPRPTSRLLISLIRSKTPIPYPYVAEKLRQTGVEPTMREPELRRRLQPILEDVVRWGYQRIAEIAKEHKLPAVAVVVPRPDMPAAEVMALAKQARIAAGYGMQVVSLEGAFTSADSVNLPPPSTHPNARGHQLLADRLYEQLRAKDARALKLGFRN